MRRCKICRFFRETYSTKSREEILFTQKCREGLSLRKLSLVLEALGCKANKDTVRFHIQNCLGLEIREQRRTEKLIEKTKKVGEKLSRFFIRPELPQTSECKHKRTRYDFENHNSSMRTSDGLVWQICLDCNQIVRKFDPEKHEKRMEKNPRNLELYRMLQSRRRRNHG